MIRTNCAICYKEFEYKQGRKLCCSKECAAARQKQLRAWDKAIKQKKSLTLSELNEKARKAGMDYGTYVARREGGMK